MNEQTVEPDWLAIARYKYLHEPEFHGFVEVLVRERLDKETARYRELEQVAREANRQWYEKWALAATVVEAARTRMRGSHGMGCRAYGGDVADAVLCDCGRQQIVDAIAAYDAGGGRPKVNNDATRPFEVGEA